MRLGAVFPQAEFDRVVGDELVEFVRRLEEAGYDHLLVYDHVLGADAGAPGPGGKASTTTAIRSWSRWCSLPTWPASAAWSW